MYEFAILLNCLNHSFFQNTSGKIVRSTDTHAPKWLSSTMELFSTYSYNTASASRVYYNHNGELEESTNTECMATSILIRGLIKNPRTLLELLRGVNFYAVRNAHAANLKTTGVLTAKSNFNVEDMESYVGGVLGVSTAVFIKSLVKEDKKEESFAYIPIPGLFRVWKYYPTKECERLGITIDNFYVDLIPKLLYGNSLGYTKAFNKILITPVCKIIKEFAFSEKVIKRNRPSEAKKILRDSQYRLMLGHKLRNHSGTSAIVTGLRQAGALNIANLRGDAVQTLKITLGNYNRDGVEINALLPKSIAIGDLLFGV